MLMKMDALFNIGWVLIAFTLGWVGSFLFNAWVLNRHRLFKRKQLEKNRSKIVVNNIGEALDINFEQAERVGFKINHDADFEVIEGIGAMTSELLKTAGYTNLFDLSQADPEDIKAMLEKVNANYKWVDTTTWPKQAELARKNRWYELKGLQDHLVNSTVSETLILNKF
jgi:predicted flap endonuclease-1-like 5' DNA nuclease